MDNIQIITDFYKALANRDIVSYSSTRYSCGGSLCETCSFSSSCGTLCGATPKGQTANDFFGEHIYPLLQQPEFSLEYLQQHYPEYFI